MTRSYAEAKPWLRAISPRRIKQNIEAITDIMRKAGFSTMAIEGFLLWTAQETDGTWDATAREYGQRRGRGGFGFIQFTNSRARGLVKFAKSINADPYLLDTQLQYFYLELIDRPYGGGTVFGRPGSWGKKHFDAAMAQASNPKEAAFVWQRYFFRPRTQTMAKVNSAARKYKTAMARVGNTTGMMPASYSTRSKPRATAPERSKSPPETKRSTSTNKVSLTKQVTAAYQRWLNVHHAVPSLRVDGILGNKTRLAASSLGRDPIEDMNVLVRGDRLEEPTVGSLKAIRALLPKLRNPVATVRAYQTFLNTKFSGSAQIRVDGSYGPITHRVAVTLGRENITDLKNLSEGKSL